MGGEKHGVGPFSVVGAAAVAQTGDLLGAVVDPFGGVLAGA